MSKPYVRPLDLYTALKDEGYILPDECYDVSLDLPVDGVYQLRFKANVDGENLARLGRALVKLAAPGIETDRRVKSWKESHSDFSEQKVNYEPACNGILPAMILETRETREPCKVCGGRGWVASYHDTGQTAVCVSNHSCSACKGLGYIATQVIIQNVDIDAIVDAVLARLADRRAETHLVKPGNVQEWCIMNLLVATHAINCASHHGAVCNCAAGKGLARRKEGKVYHSHDSTQAMERRKRQMQQQILRHGFSLVQVEAAVNAAAEQLKFVKPDDGSVV